MTNKEIVDWIWHDAIEDKNGFACGAGIIKMNLSVEITPKETKKRFIEYFEETTGIKPYTKCPLCQNELVPRKSRYGYFVGCSAYPKCTFKALPKK